MAQLKFVDYILDNIHGYIPLTELESQIEKLPVFRRLRGIKQLGLTNWIFPGAEHTRYSHSLGVMHIADSMAARLGFTPEERQLIRVAGMLHDIGHYPLSHVGERAYKNHGKPAARRNTIEGCARRFAMDDTDDPRFITHTYMQKSDNPFHHEAIGEAVIRASGAISGILAQNGIDIDDVCAIITGDIKSDRLVRFVQILHCEMDADRIDYLLRDTSSSGTSYGSFEINGLIKNMAMTRRNDYGVDIIGVNAKGVMSADQFLINRYFAYTQVFYHKYVSVLSSMGERIISYMLERGETFPSGDTLLEWINRQNSGEDYFAFTDVFFLNAIRDMNVHTCRAPLEIAAMADMLNHYLTPEIMHPEHRHNIILSGMTNGSILEGMAQSGLLSPRTGAEDGGLTTVDESFITEHTRIGEFTETYYNKKDAFRLNYSLDDYLKHRLINGIAYIATEGAATLLYDAPASLTKDLCRHRTVFFRTYALE